MPCDHINCGNGATGKCRHQLATANALQELKLFRTMFSKNLNEIACRYVCMHLQMITTCGVYTVHSIFYEAILFCEGHIRYDYD